MIAVKIVEFSGHFTYILILFNYHFSEEGIIISISKMVILRPNEMKLPRVTESFKWQR